MEKLPEVANDPWLNEVFNIPNVEMRNALIAIVGRPGSGKYLRFNLDR